jgi:hypothetical protein
LIKSVSGDMALRAITDIDSYVCFFVQIEFDMENNTIIYREREKKKFFSELKKKSSHDIKRILSNI